MSISGAIKKELKRMWKDLGKSTGDYALVDAGVHPDTIRRRDAERKRRRGGAEPPDETLPVSAILVCAILIALVLAACVLAFVVI